MGASVWFEMWRVQKAKALLVRHTCSSVVVTQVMEQRQAESQALLHDESRAASEQGGIAANLPEPSRRSRGGGRQEAATFSLNLSFEELSGAGLEEPPRISSSSHWPVSVAPSAHGCYRVMGKVPQLKLTHTRTRRW